MAEKRKIDNLRQLVETAGSNLNILEEEIDIDVQQQYLQLARRLAADPESYPALSKECIGHIEDLFEPSTPEDTLKKMLVVLATVDDVSIYRSLEKFAAAAGPLQKWGTIALQQSRMLLQSTLLDDPGVFISTGLGGHAGRLRYFCVFFYRKGLTLEAYQQHVVASETEAALQKAGGSIEEMAFKEGYTSIRLLLPLETDLQPLFNAIIDECNLYGNFLHQNMILTNVRKLSEEELQKLVRLKNRPHTSTDIPLP